MLYLYGKYRLYKNDIVNYFNKYSVGAINKNLQEWCFYLTIDQSKLLLEHMELGDGHIMKNGTIRYDTSSIQLANDYQQLCLHAGFSANLHLKYEAGHESYCASRDEIFKSTVESYRLTRITTQNTPIVNKNIKFKTGENRNDNYFSKTSSFMDGNGKFSDLLNSTLNKTDAFSQRMNQTSKSFMSKSG